MIEGTPKTIQHLDPDTYEWVDSNREYVEAVEGLEYNEEVGDYYTHTERRRVSLYLDPLTGLVVFDVVAYEKWMGER